MRRDTLIDFFDDLARSTADFLVYDDGYRRWSYRYVDVARAARAFAARLRRRGLAKGDKAIFWGENRPEWIAALWGCLLEGVIVVPIDYRASVGLLHKVREIVDAKVALVGTDVAASALRGRVDVWSMADLEWPREDVVPAGERSQHAPMAPDDTAEIIFTSGATAEPKGVVITHRNVLANIVPVEREVLKYRKYGRPFFPLRFLNLLPLSHMFGQAMATFIPPMLPGVVIFMRGYNPADIVRQIKTRRVSVLVCVPKILDVLREHVGRVVPDAATPAATAPHWLVRWWRYRALHRMFGWKFWAFVVGAAPLDRELEEYWSRLGYLVIQGYGLTETAPIVSLNHPFEAQKGSVGKPIAGVEVKIAPDGEILVRGENVTKGYYRAAAETADAFEGGWFHTGDIGTIDETGRLFVRGRKKEMIVTPEGLNVFPEDVERVLEGLAGVREAAAVGVTSQGEERVHAVLVLDPGVDGADVVRQANATLEDHQKVRSFSIWPGDSLPRTEGTRKLKRREIRAWATGAAPARAAAGASPGESLEAIVERFAAGRRVAADTTLEELGLSSLERVELMMALEERFQTTLDEASFSAARTLRDLQRLVEQPERAAALPEADRHALQPTDAGPPARAAVEPIDFPSWNRRLLARAVRRMSLPTWILPIARVFAHLRVEGRAHLAELQGPVVFAANHQSHMDTPVILAALPARWRYRVAPAMAKEFFKAHFYPERYSRRERLTNSLNYYLAALFFNAFPLPQREAGTRQTMRYIGELVSQGFSILIFPEGRRTEAGEINRFQAGVGMIGSRLAVPIVPVRLEGLDRVLHQSWRMARPGSVRVAFGQALRMKGDNYAALARQVEDTVRNL